MEHIIIVGRMLIAKEGVYAKTLDELRYKEKQIERDKKDGIKAEARYTTLNDLYELWKDLKCGLKNNILNRLQ